METKNRLASLLGLGHERDERADEGAEGSARRAADRLRAVKADEAAAAKAAGSGTARQARRAAVAESDTNTITQKTEAPGKGPDAATREEKEMPTQSTESTQAADAAAPLSMTILSPSLRMKGAEIDSDEDLTVHGHFDGKLRCRHLIVSPGASVRGEIVAQVARVSGEISGDIKAESLLLFKGGSIGGSVQCRSMGIQPGSRVKAAIDCDQSEPIGAAEPRPASAPAAAQPASTMAAQDGEFSQQNFLRVVRGNG